MQKASADTTTVAKSAGLVSIAIMCSRVLGLIREQVFAYFFGAGFAYDSFVVAFRIPNLLRDLFGEGALSAAFVSVFSDYNVNKGEVETWKLANNVLAFFGILLSLLTLLGIYFAEDLVLLLVDGEFEADVAKVALTTTLASIMFPFLILISLSAVVMGALNTKGKFFVPAMASAFFNMGSIVGGLGCVYWFSALGYPPISGMAVGTLIGGGLQLCCQLPLLRKVGFRLRPYLNLRDPGLRRILVLLAPAVIGVSATQFNVFVNTKFASACIPGSVSWLNYGFRLVQLPIGVFGVALSTATLPLLAKYISRGEVSRVRDSLASSLTMGFCLAIPSAVGLWVLAEPIIRLIFEHGRFNAVDTMNTASVLRFYSLGLFAYAAVKILAPAFYALEDSRVPVIGSFLAVGVNYGFVSYFVGEYGFNAIAMSLAVSMSCNFLFLFVVLSRKLSGFSYSYVGLALVKIIIAAGCMGGWLYFAAGLFDPAAWSLLQQVLSVGFYVVTGGAVYGVLLHMLQLHEMTAIIAKVKTRIAG
ncbi:MAG: murein biosynthesis integral membrane protein MurJ [Desulfobulbaceae bacterium]|jgi:putative peptidoglycan lipid II flippase|nr:murein biosynthesis integral membrane protein MurJ [Desulfobulbaceae bacterium]